MDYIQIKTDTLKNYGKDKELWYHSKQGETYLLFMETKKGYLVVRHDTDDDKKWLVRKSHGSLIEVDENNVAHEILDDIDDDIV